MQTELTIAEIQSAANDIRTLLAAIQNMTAGTPPAGLVKLAASLADQIQNDASNLAS